MKAPLSKHIKKILSDKESSYNLMRAIIDGARNGEHAVRLNGKSFTLRRVGVSKSVK